jgi:hypothetical protein
MTASEFEKLVAFGLAGLVVGGASLASLRLNTDLYVGGGLWRPVGLHLARLAMLAAAMVWAAHQGAGPLLAGAAGLMLARPIAMRSLGRTR